MTPPNSPATKPELDLDACASEPIHIPGSIQPHGVLFACEGETLTIVRVSSNADEFLGVDARALLGRSLLDHVDTNSGARLLALRETASFRAVNPFGIVSNTGAVFGVNAHRTGTSLVIELERHANPTDPQFGSFDPRLRASVMRLHSAMTVERLCSVAAEEVKKLTGFDRVMVYRFDADWNGKVVAEARREDLEPFLGQHYPASDIPAQARRLYTVNHLRFIGDVQAVPVPILSSADAPPGPFDMSHSVLRSVSPIHIQYMRNMGVTASMSISLVLGGQLAGLIACHHYAGPFVVPTALRDTAEYMATNLSWHLGLVEAADRSERDRKVQLHEAELVRSVAIAGELLDGLDSPALLGLAGAQGAAVVLQDGIRRIGETPGIERLRALVAWLKERPEDVYATHALASEFGPAAETESEEESWAVRSAGVLAVAIARDLGEYILWFRPAVERVVDWAGDPRKSVTPREDGRPDRLTPRGSFALWREVVKGKAEPWEPWHVESVSNLRRVILGGVRKRAATLRDMNEHLLRADRAKDDFIATVSHELRTPLNALGGWTKLLQSGDLSPEKRVHALDVIARNVEIQRLLVEDLLDVSRMTTGKVTLEVDDVDVGFVVQEVVDAHALAFETKNIRLVTSFDSRRTTIRGDAMRLRQVVTNLVTNALKFTAKGGNVGIHVERVRSDVEIRVVDDGQGIAEDFLPNLFDPFRQQDSKMNRRSQGLGLGLAIVKKLVSLHGGHVTAESDGPGKGSVFRIRLPMTSLLAKNDGRPAAESSGTTKVFVPNSLAGVKILAIDDNPDALDMMSQVLQMQGAEVTTAGDALEGLQIAAQGPFDVIVSDVGLPEMDGFEFMKALRARVDDPNRETPAIALTAYARESDKSAAMEAGYQLHLGKPIDLSDLAGAIWRIVSRTPATAGS
ncbi:MAG: ATP-binding protein [Polyangiaceae bacterium]